MSTVTVQQALQTALGHHQAGRLAEAEALYRQVLAVQPLNPYALNLLGVVAYQVGQPDAAVDLIARAITLKADEADFHGNLGNALSNLGKLGEAVACFRRALELLPDIAEVHNNLGNALNNLGQTDEAIASIRRALELKPDYAEIHSNLGTALNRTGQTNAAIACFRRALELQPDNTISHSGLVFTLHFHPGYDAPMILEEHRQWAQRHERPRRAFQKPHANTPEPNRRLKVGYVSPDLREHPIGRFLVPLLEHHDHDPFEITCYADVARPDDVTDRLRHCADRWQTTTGWTEERLAEQIRRDEIDLLVDLALHSAQNRLTASLASPRPYR